MNTRKNEWSSLFGTIPLVLLGLTFLLLPLLYSTITTDAFMLPKHYLLAIAVTLSILTIGIKMIIDGKLSLRTTPFDIPVILFTVVIFISALLSVNRYDSLMSFVPVLYTTLLYFLIVNVVKGEKALTFLLGCLLVGATLSGLVTILGFFHVYALPFAYAKSPYFTTIGTLFDQALYLALVLPIAGYFGYMLVSSLTNSKKANTPFSDDSGRNASKSTKVILFSIASVFIAVALLATLYYLFTSQRPVILPFSNGFQIAFATISQDAGRMLQSFLFGSGMGTFITDFTRFKQPAYNTNAALWSVTFLRSSSFILELLATTGLLGVLSFFFIIFQFLRQRSFFLPLLVGFIAAFIFPFSPIVMTVLFGLLGIFAVVRAQNNNQGYNDLEVHLETIKSGLFSVTPEHAIHTKRYTKALPVIVFLLLAGLVGYSGYYTTIFALSDATFQQSLIAAASNNGSQTYTLQQKAISQFPYRDSYHRVFSQTNLALANALAAQTPKGSSPSAQTQQNVLTLIQQSITTGRSATALAPYSVVNWNNLGTVYRSLIGFGQNADQFAILTNQQAIALDPNNPQQYVNLGGIYYQLGAWDEASRQFQIAINFKKDYANAYYNLGHTLEAKGDIKNALLVYNAVKTLVASDKDNSKRISEEIEALKAKTENQQVAGAQVQPSGEEKVNATVDANGKDLKVNSKAETQLPERNPKAKIEGPTISPIPSPSVSPAASPIPTSNQ